MHNEAVAGFKDCYCELGMGSGEVMESDGHCTDLRTLLCVARRQIPDMSVVHGFALGQVPFAKASLSGPGIVERGIEVRRRRTLACTASCSQWHGEVWGGHEEV